MINGQRLKIAIAYQSLVHMVQTFYSERGQNKYNGTFNPNVK